MRFNSFFFSLVIRLLGVFLLGLAGIVHAQNFNQCKGQLYAASVPQLQNSALKQNTYPLCFNGFAVLYSGISRTPLWSAEHLTPQRLAQAKSIKRQDNFHEESRIPERHRSHLSDYARSGYDRGHMAPNGDMATPEQQYDSFSLANMVPQSPKNNQEVWRNLEEAVRSMVARQRQAAYVITGPAFLDSKLKQVGQVLVPTHVYKAVYFPKLNMAGAYLAPNDQSGRVEVISIHQLEQTVGINLFPNMLASTKTKQAMLPLTAKQANNMATSAKPAQKNTESHSTPSRSNGKPTGSEADWLEFIKHQLAQLLVSLLRTE